MEAVIPHDHVSTQRNRSVRHMGLGLLLLLPALYCWLSQLLLPTVRTLLMSFQKVDLFGLEAEFVGLANYTDLFADENFWQAAGFTLLVLLVRLFVVALLPLLLAWAAGQLGRRLRLGLRVLLTLPVVFFAPVAIAIAWLLFLNPVNGLLPWEGSWASSPGRARAVLLFIDALSLAGLASGLGLMAFLPLWRRAADVPPPSLRDIRKPMLATWALGILGVIVLTLSTFTLNMLLTNGGPARSTTTLGFLFYNLAFRNFNMRPAAAVASLILLVTLVAGTLAGLIFIFSRLRLDTVDPEPGSETAAGAVAPAQNRAPASVAFVVLGLLTLGICLVSALPFGWLIPQSLDGDGPGQLFEQISAGRVLINTLVPPLVTVTLQVLIAYLAALGIGALRPFGKHSEWLLLLFSPWLFIGLLPLSLVHFLGRQQSGRLDTALGSLSPILLSIPALFVLTIFFAARASRLPRQTTEGEVQEASGFFQHFLVPSLPLAAVLWLVLLIFNAQDLLWPLLVSVSPEQIG